MLVDVLMSVTELAKMEAKELSQVLSMDPSKIPKEAEYNSEYDKEIIMKNFKFLERDSFFSGNEKISWKECYGQNN